MSNQKSPFWSNLFKPAQSVHQNIVSLWSKTPLFKGISKSALNTLSKEMHIRHYKPQEIIFKTDDNGEGVILILSGTVAIKSGETILTELSKGEFFGEVALSSNDKRTATAVCIDEAELVFFLRQDLKDWIDHTPSMAAIFLLNLNKVLAERLRSANSRLSQ